MQILPPFSAPMPKKAGAYRWLLLIQHPSRRLLQQLLAQFEQDKANLAIPSSIRLSLDVDPLEWN